MDNKSNNDNTNGSTFWKRYMNAVPGRPSRHKEENANNHKDLSLTLFQDFEKKVSDAWEINEDELLYISALETSDSVQAQNSDIIIKNLETDRSDQSCFRKKEKPQKSTLKDRTHSSNILEIQPQTHKVMPVMSSSAITNLETCTGRFERFQVVLDAPLVDLEELQRLSWSGVPSEVRPKVWRLLTGYIPICSERQEDVLKRKRSDYWELIKQYYNPPEWDDSQNTTFRQIHIDIPRMSQVIHLFQQRTVQKMFERILFIWAMRHPASGYVQGINDLVTPFFVIFLKEIVKTNEDVGKVKIDSILEERRAEIEADSFWCFSKFLDGVQDNYTFAQLGVQRKVKRLKELVQRIDSKLHKHLQDNGIDYIQFSYRWMNNLLTRELSLKCTIRLWDTYLAEVDSFATLHDYICAAFLEHWRERLLMEKDFQGLMLTLQNLPTKYWTEAEIEILVAEAYKLKYSFDDAPNHLANIESS